MEISSSDISKSEKSANRPVEGHKDLFNSILLLLVLIFLAALVVTSILGYLYISVAIIVVLFVSLILLLRAYRSEVKSLDIRFNDMQRKVEKKEAFISDFSHLIRTRLNNFSLIIDLMGETSMTEKQKELMDTLIASNNNMVNAVNELSRLSAEEITFETRNNIKLDLISTLQGTIDLFGLKPESDAVIDIVAAEDLKKSYLSDPVALKQIFLDLFNSMEMKGNHDLIIQIMIEPEGRKGNRDLIRFDFRTNRQVQYLKTNLDDPSRFTNPAVNLISLLDGKYSFSIDNEETVFSFTIPMDAAVENEGLSAAAQRIKDLNQGKSSSKSLTDANILLVEDNPTNQKIVLISLRNKVKSIETANNGKEALDMFGKSNYDLILMDVQLPVMDGITSVQKIRELESSTSKHTPVIAITANAMLGDKEKCLSAGMDEYLSKPFQPNKLISMIEKLLNG